MCNVLLRPAKKYSFKQNFCFKIFGFTQKSSYHVYFKKKKFLSAVTRIDLGLPLQWITVAFWLSFCTVSSKTEKEISPNFNKKCPEIPSLRSYRYIPDSCFWKEFPKFKAKKRVKARLRPGVLKRLIQKCWFSWDCHQRKIAKQALQTITHGALTV